jgi:hypothetical protein
MKRGTVTWGKAGLVTAAIRRIDVDEARLRQLIQLCHPDKHNGSATATEVFQWLQEIKRKALDKG